MTKHKRCPVCVCEFSEDKEIKAHVKDCRRKRCRPKSAPTPLQQSGSSQLSQSVLEAGIAAQKNAKRRRLVDRRDSQGVVEEYLQAL